MSANVVVVPSGSENGSLREIPFPGSQQEVRTQPKLKSAGNLEISSRKSLGIGREQVSSWSRSGLKRLFDLVCVLLALPLLVPIFLAVGLAVRMTSRGPVLFLQKRTGRYRRNFTILKFRTMEHRERGAHSSVTTTENQRFTPVGPFLRKWKLDELPQLLNVLLGNMSLVGPRPKMPEHQLGELSCRPGITGGATIAFAREEEVLACLPDHHLDGYYHSVVLPAKLRLDTEYMAQATFLSDLKLIFDTAVRRWDSSAMYQLLEVEKPNRNLASFNSPAFKEASARTVPLPNDESLASAD